METFAEELKISGQMMSEVFPQSKLPKAHVHILVELPSSKLIVVMLFDHRHYYIQ
jgi:hypothetical protein